MSRRTPPPPINGHRVSIALRNAIYLRGAGPKSRRCSRRASSSRRRTTGQYGPACRGMAERRPCHAVPSHRGRCKRGPAQRGAPTPLHRVVGVSKNPAVLDVLPDAGAAVEHLLARGARAEPFDALGRSPPHSAHHTYPAVPFHRLPELHAELTRRLGYAPPTVGYVEFQRRFIAALARGPEPMEGVSEAGPVIRRVA